MTIHIRQEMESDGHVDSTVKNTLNYDMILLFNCVKTFLMDDDDGRILLIQSVYPSCLKS